MDGFDHPMQPLYDALGRALNWDVDASNAAEAEYELLRKATQYAQKSTPLPQEMKIALACLDGVESPLETVLMESSEPSKNYLFQLMEDFTKHRLNEREREIMYCFVHGLTGVKTAEVLGLRPGTVNNYYTSAYAKLGITGKKELCQKYSPGFSDEFYNGLEKIRKGKR